MQTGKESRGREPGNAWTRVKGQRELGQEKRGEETSWDGEGITSMCRFLCGHVFSAPLGKYQRV